MLNMLRRSMRKPNSAEAPPAPWVDLHCHLLPGIDDGPRTWRGSLDLLRAAQASGTRRLVATSHLFSEYFQNVSIDRLRQAFAEFQERLIAEREGDDPDIPRAIEVHFGAENYASGAFLQALEDGNRITLNGSRYLLVEFSPNQGPAGMRSCLSAIQRCGLIPVLAHAERYLWLRDRPAAAEELTEQGVVLQVNAASLEGSHGSRAQNVTWRLLRRGLAAAVASDGHAADRRGPGLRSAAARVFAEMGEAAMRRLFVDNPGLVADNRCLFGARRGEALVPLQMGKPEGILAGASA